MIDLTPDQIFALRWLGLSALLIAIAVLVDMGARAVIRQRRQEYQNKLARSVRRARR
ncbi:hypothetical protein ACFQH5_20445 [Halomonas salifodinae]|uniref:Heme exporter protein D n=1 Tax=Halomonas salifodinae TaxID=438745 RepID=A0ABW2F4T4_9GAMM